MATTYTFKGIEFASATAVKNYVREMTASIVAEVFANRFGSDCVTLVGSNEYAICVGTIADSDGFEREVCVSLKPTAKDFVDRTMPSTGKVVEAYDRISEGEAYSVEVAEKAEKKEKERIAREEKKARDKAERERKKAEKATKSAQ